METWVLGDLRTWELGDLGTWGLGTWEVGGWGTWGIPKADKAGNLETKGAVQGGLRNFDLGTTDRAWAVGKGRVGVSLLVKLSTRDLHALRPRASADLIRLNH